MADPQKKPSSAGGKHRRRRAVLLGVLAVAILALAGAVAVLLPILTHQSAGGSGQQVPQSFVAEASAMGADGRNREVVVETESGRPADLAEIHPGDVLVVHGSGFDASIGIYVSICAVPSTPGSKPSPCLGGIPAGAESGEAAGDTLSSSVWITDDWAWRAFASHGYDDAAEGSFTARLLVPDAVSNGLDCRALRCAVTTRSDHTAAADRVQDMQLPVAFAD